MARAPLIEVDAVPGAFAESLRSMFVPTHASPHLTERDLGALWDTARVQPGDSLTTMAIVEAWMALRGERMGVGYTVLDTTKVADACGLIRHGIEHGLVSTEGQGDDLRVRRTSPTERVYERNPRGGGGRLVLPRVRGGRSAERVQADHADVAAPIAEALLHRIADRTAGEPVPDWWIEAGYVSPEHAGNTVLARLHVLRGVHGAWVVSRQITWLAMLRHDLWMLGEPPPAPLPEDDAAALAMLGGAA